MTTLQNRPNTALLIIDMQVGVIAKAVGRDAVVRNVASLVAKARQETVPVIWVRHADEQLIKGSDGWQIVPELHPGNTEPLIEKIYGDGQDVANPRAAGVPWTSDESYEWLPGNFFVLHRWDAQMGKHEFKGAEIMG